MINNNLLQHVVALISNPDGTKQKQLENVRDSCQMRYRYPWMGKVENCNKQQVVTYAVQHEHV